MTTRRLNIRVTEDLHDRLELLAEVMDTSIQGVVTELLVQGVDRAHRDGALQAAAEARIASIRKRAGLE